MKSFCIKTNNIEMQNYLLNRFECIPLDEVYFIKRKFKIFHNIIIHYKGIYIDDFLGILSNIITDCILIHFEPILIDRNINLNYFYFDDYEKKLIEKTCYMHILEDEDDTLKFRRDEIYNNVLRYIYESKSMILEGFVNFRLQDYTNTIDEVVDFSVNKYIVEKEYNDFINLLRMYVESKETNSNLVHILYNNKNSTMLDEAKNIIEKDTNISSGKYLSDISFSSNDYTLNTLLTLLPKKIIIHIIVGPEDEFVNTLKLVFGSRVYICYDCDICSMYRVSKNIIKK